MLKRLSALVLFSAILAAAAFTAEAAAPRAQVRQVIGRTAVVLVAAQKAAAKEHKYAGLALAVAHQRYARRMYAKGSYLAAIFHSLRARELAVIVLKRNGAALIREAVLNSLEKDYARKAPAGKELDGEIEGEEIGSDEDAVDVTIETDIN